MSICEGTPCVTSPHVVKDLEVFAGHIYEEIRVLTSLTGLFKSKAALLLIIQPQYALEAGFRCL